MLIRRFKGFHVAPFLFELLKMVIGVALMIISLWAAMKWVPLTNVWLRCLAFGMIGLAVYVLVLLLLKEQTFISFLSRKKKVSLGVDAGEESVSSKDSSEEQ